jgi:hypothetical protein
MTPDGVVTDVPLFGDIHQWKAAKPLIQLALGGTPILDGKINGTVLTANWSLSGKQRWGKDLNFSVQITSPDKLESVPTLSPFTFAATPKLERLEISGPAGKLCLVGTSHAIPIDKNLTILCEKQDASGNWGLDEHTTKAIKYQRGRVRGYGRCAEDGQFKASLDGQHLNEPRRFTWKYCGEGGTIDGFDPGSVTVFYGEGQASSASTY